VESHGIRYHEREAGRFFCNESSRKIVDMLRSECDRAAVVLGFQQTRVFSTPSRSLSRLEACLTPIWGPVISDTQSQNSSG
jgi:predicted flavoprotein YhiN